MLEYKNGALKALGQCRVNVDPYKKYLQPSGICVQACDQPVEGEPDAQSIRVAFKSTSHEHHPADAGWKCMPLSGGLCFYFSPQDTALSIRPDRRY